MLKQHPSHVIAARKILCAVCTSLATKWFNSKMWEESDPVEVQDKTLAMNVLAKTCIKLATTLRLIPVSQLAVRKRDNFIRKYAKDLLKIPHGEEQSRKAIALLEVANLTQCDVVAITKDDGEWNALYRTTRELLEKYFYPYFPEAEDEGMQLYMAMCGS